MEFSDIMILVFIGVGILGAVGLGMYFRHNMNHVPNPVETTGEVMEIEPRNVPDTNPINRLFSGGDDEGGGKIYYHPVVRFRVDGQKLVRFRNRKGFGEDAYKVGDQVKVMYSKNNPLIARVIDA